MNNTFEEARALAQEAIEGLVRKHIIACEELTEKQLVEVIRQMLASGDIIRNVVVGTGAQGVNYIPFAESERLRRRILDLEAILESHGIKENRTMEERMGENF